MVNFNVITACSRPENLDRLYDSIYPHRKNHNIRWIIVYDNTNDPVQYPEPWIHSYCHVNKRSIVGNAQKNFAIELLTRTDDWLYFLDDDNLLHPKLFDTVSDYIRADTMKIRGFIFEQEIKDGIRKLPEPNTVEPGNIDIAQILIHREIVCSSRFALEKYQADGLFIQECHERGHSWCRISEVLSYYNKLRGGEIVTPEMMTA